MKHCNAPGHLQMPDSDTKELPKAATIAGPVPSARQEWQKEKEKQLILLICFVLFSPLKLYTYKFGFMPYRKITGTGNKTHLMRFVVQ